MQFCKYLSRSVLFAWPSNCHPILINVWDISLKHTIKMWICATWNWKWQCPFKRKISFNLSHSINPNSWNVSNKPCMYIADISAVSYVHILLTIWELEIIHDRYLSRHLLNRSDLYREVVFPKTFLGRAVAQAVSRCLPIAAPRVRVRAACGGQSGIRADFLRVLRFPLPIIPLISPWS
jgi:hypothetical protein